MSEINECRRLTLMMRVADVARADVALTPERIYYRFATDDSIEDGELPAGKEDFGDFAARLVDCVAAHENENQLKEDVKLSVFIDNRLSDVKASEESLRRLVGELCAVADEFAFLAGFC